MKNLLAVALLCLSTSAFAQSSISNATYPLAHYPNGFRTINGTQLNAMVDEVNNITQSTGTANAIFGTNGTFTGNLTVTGTQSFTGNTTFTGNVGINTTGTSAFLVGGTQTATTSSFSVQAVAGTAGLNVHGAAHNGTVAVAVTDSSGNTNLTLDAKLAGTIGIGTVSTGAVTIGGASTIATGLVTDATKTDATVCEDTTTHQLYFGSGTAGICLGTSSKRYKNHIENLTAGLDEILQLQAKSYYLNADHGDPTKKLYGFVAEDVHPIIPELVGMDIDGKPNTFDLLGLVPILVNAVQQLQAEVVQLKQQQAAN